MTPVIFDTGPLVAWLCPRDQHHQWALRAFTSIRSPGIVCEAVLTEDCHLAAKEGVPRAKVIDLVHDGRLAVVSLAGELPIIRNLLERYADTPMDFADGCIVRLAELNEDSPVCTTDTDFLVFRKDGNKPISVIAPFHP